ncbi:MAG: hypothetical protein AAF497_04860 [Planctomycetota bacterium]
MKILAFASALIALSFSMIVGPIATETGPIASRDTANETQHVRHGTEAGYFEPVEFVVNNRFQDPFLGFELNGKFWESHARVFPVQELMSFRKGASLTYSGKSYETELLNQTRLIHLQIDQSVFTVESMAATVLTRSSL